MPLRDAALAFLWFCCVGAVWAVVGLVGLPTDLEWLLRATLSAVVAYLAVRHLIRLADESGPKIL